MLLDPVRKARQVELGDQWRVTKCGTLECATGFGKTISALLIIREERRVNNLLTVLVVVPTRYLKKQWEDRLTEVGIQDVEVEVINTVVKGKHDYDLLILDEIHQYTAEIFGQVFDRVNYSQILGLTATLDYEDLRMQLIHVEAPVVGVVTMQECMTKGWIAPFQVYNLEVHLTPKEDAAYKAISSKFNRSFAMFGHDFKLAMACATSSQKAKEYARLNNWDDGQVSGAAYNWLSSMRKRKDFLYDLESKHQVAKDIIDLFEDRMIITFSQTIDSAENLANKLGKNAEVYHSRLKGRVVKGKKLSAKAAKQYAIDRFSSKHHWSRCNVLCTAKAMDQGADLPDIDMAIVLSATSKTLQAIQRYGRSLRATDGKRTIIVELFVPGTQDERWLRKRQAKLPKGVVKRITRLEEIV